jgi:hypothetical protein
MDDKRNGFGLCEFSNGDIFEGVLTEPEIILKEKKEKKKG